MNQNHHEQLALDAVRSLAAIRSAGGLDGNLISKLVKLLGDTNVRWQYKQSASLPDRIRDTACELPDFFPDKYSVKGHNLSSFQHFQCMQGAEDFGYRWQKDPSLSLIGEVGDELMEVFHAFIRYRPERSNETPPVVLGPDGHPQQPPMAGWATKQPNCTLDNFAFPAAAEVGDFYARGARGYCKQDNGEGWRRCAGFALHFVADALVPHHCWGALLFGHSDWEDQIADYWNGHIRRIQFVDNNKGQLYAETVGNAVAQELKQADLQVPSVAELIRANAAYTSDWLAKTGVNGPSNLGNCPPNAALRICIRGVASSVRALTLMVA
jgi:hypothetical protein